MYVFDKRIKTMVPKEKKPILVEDMGLAPPPSLWTILQLIHFFYAFPYELKIHLFTAYGRLDKVLQSATALVNTKKGDQKRRQTFLDKWIKCDEDKCETRITTGIGGLKIKYFMKLDKILVHSRVFFFIKDTFY